MNKNSLRKILREKRTLISTDERARSAQSALACLKKDSVFLDSQHIACYLAEDNEFDCMPMIQMIWQMKKKCYLPVLSSEETQDASLSFALYEAEDDLRPNRYHILEPVRVEKFPAENLDLVLVPLVGFDELGNRLGMGGGYYDRTFEFLLKKRTKPFLLGLSFEAQQVDPLPTDAWDVRLDGVLTEQRMVKF